MAIIFHTDDLLGDSICANGAIIQIAKENPNNCYIMGKNRPVIDLIPKKYGLKWWEENPSTDAPHMVYKLGIKEVFDRFGGQHQYHPTVGYFKLIKRIPPNERAVNPEIEFEIKDQPQYDYVISAMSKANGKRMWPLTEWQKLLPQLEGSICMVGQAGDDTPFGGIDYFYGYSLQDVAAVLKKAKCVITIDNGIGRLAQGVGCNHVLLCSNVVGEVWGSYPEAHLIYDTPTNFGVDRVRDLVRSVI